MTKLQESWVHLKMILNIYLNAAHEKVTQKFPKLDTAEQKISAGAHKASEAIKGAAHKVSDAAKGAAHKVSDVARNAKTKAQNAASTVKDGIKFVAKFVYRVTTHALSVAKIPVVFAKNHSVSTYNKAAEAFHAHVLESKAVEKMKKGASTAKESVKKAAAVLTKPIRTVAAATKGFAKAGADKVTKKTSPILQTLRNKFRSGSPKGKELVKITESATPEQSGADKRNIVRRVGAGLINGVGKMLKFVVDAARGGPKSDPKQGIDSEGITRQNSPNDPSSLQELQVNGPRPDDKHKEEPSTTEKSPSLDLEHSTSQHQKIEPSHQNDAGRGIGGKKED